MDDPTPGRTASAYGPTQQPPTPGSASRAADQAPVLPSIGLPKGGGAIRGIGEKFTANPVTGTGSASVPIALSEGRSGFGPELSLSYDSGSGNGVFGFGWTLSTPSITRKTDKGIPRYVDALESDVFLLSGAEDLVPELDDNLDRIVDAGIPGFTIHRYRPRVEGLFARIERWTSSTGDVHWRSITKDNLLTLYGASDESRIADPADQSRIYSWLICETRDDKGNAVVYEYARDNGSGVAMTAAHEQQRGPVTDARRRVNRYLKRIRYGNRTPLLDGTGRRPLMLTSAQRAAADWMFEAILDYDEGHVFGESTDPAGHEFVRADINPTSPWTHRVDAFSSYRSGFEIRTTRLCRRVLMFHHFASEPGVGANCLIRSTDFTYSDGAASSTGASYALLETVTSSGYRTSADGYLRRSMPALEFGYTTSVIATTIEELDQDSLRNLPAGLDEAFNQLVDLHGEGSAGILTEQGGAWFFKRNLSAGSDNNVARFGMLEQVRSKPSVDLATAQFMDLAGDGRLDVVTLDRPAVGLFEHDDEEGWRTFRAISAPTRSLRDADVRFVDLDGDGITDVLITEDDAIVWHASLGAEGFAPESRKTNPLDERVGPRLRFSDGSQSIFLADMTGDGLNDLVRVRSADVSYWPNLGYGRFGPRVTMEDAPHLDSQEQFEPRRIRLADLDGSGTADIVYLHRDGVRLYFNESGNGWVGPHTLPGSLAVDDARNITVTDLLGNGTACLVWSSPLLSDARRPMRYVRLMGAQKPHLLATIHNGLGARTTVDYAPSTAFYVRDRLAGRAWVTRLPFPVQVVERVETHDVVSGNRFVSRHAYHHGYFDGVEREFRGFGMVERWDTEEIGTAPPVEGGDIDSASRVPPMLTRTWYHTGASLGRQRVSAYFAQQPPEAGGYYREPGWSPADLAKHLLPDTVLPPGLSLDEEREACRSLKGSMLRQEIYGLDGTDEAAHPYLVTEQNFTIEPLQRRGGNQHAVFYTHPCESLSYQYERDPGDPRVAHTLTLDVDPLGNVLKSVAASYPRRLERVTLQGNDREAQLRTLITYTESDYTQADLTVSEDWVGAYRTALPFEKRTFEITGLALGQDAVRFAFDDLVVDSFQALTGLPEALYERPADATQPARRLIERTRTLYRRNDLASFLPPARHASLGLPGETYQLAFTPGLLDTVFRRGGTALVPEPQDVLGGVGPDRGGYVDLDVDGHRWRPAGESFYSPVDADDAPTELDFARRHFFLVHRSHDPFGQVSVVHYDSDEEDATRNHNLMPVSTEDALGNVVRADIDYRVLHPRGRTDPNGNRSAVVFDALGMVVGTAVMGKPAPGPVEGDSFDDFDVDLSPQQVQAFFDATDPRALAVEHLGSASTRILYDIERVPACAAAVLRETHQSELADGIESQVQLSFTYCDGFGREVQRKVQAEPGQVPLRGPDGRIVVGPDGRPQLVDGGGAPRWVGSGWTVFNNKGKPVRQFEPFFSDSHTIDLDVRIGVSPWLCYDSLDRVIATVHPDHTWEKVVFDAWQQSEYDANDTVLNATGTADPADDPDVAGVFARLPSDDYLPTWYQERIALAIDDPRRAAAESTAVHRQTPTTRHLDVLGRPFVSFTHNRFLMAGVPVEETYPARVELDIEGNQRAVRDATVDAGVGHSRLVARYDYDMLGNRIHQQSMEAGETWTLDDVTGKLVRAWDGRMLMRRISYDELRRPSEVFLAEDGVGRVASRTVYGEGQGAAGNHRTKVYQVFDGAGVLTSVSYDFKGNLLQSGRRLLSDYRTKVDWRTDPGLDDEFSTTTTYDAMNRQRTAVTPDATTHRPTYNEANLLEAVDVNLHAAQQNGEPVWTAIISDIDYDPKGQRVRIDCANGASTTLEYDQKTFRLVRLRTTRPSRVDTTASRLLAAATVIQDLTYTYDAVGNATRIDDAAARTVFHNNQEVAPGASYTYDATYRLIEARGREHIGQTAHATVLPPGNRRDHDLVGLDYFIAHPHDLEALRRYAERYEYDAVGNLTATRHVSDGGNWTRTYAYEHENLLEPGRKNNRLTRTAVGNGSNFVEAYGYVEGQSRDAAGCITSINSLSLAWDADQHLESVDLGGGGTAYYAYDMSGRRIRKVLDDANGVRRAERVYLGSFERYRTFDADPVTRETLSIVDDTRRVALIETEVAPEADDPVVRYQLGDHLTSTAVELDADAALITYEEYYPFGTSAFQAGRSAAEVGLKRYRYTGQERDEETGLTYHKARYCAPWLGRWVSADPAGLVDGPNLYRYARNNPIRLNDPSGTDPPRSTTPSASVTPILTDVELTGVTGNFTVNNLLSSDRSVSGSGMLAARARTGLLVNVPRFGLSTSGVAQGDVTAAVDTSLGRGRVLASGGLLLGDLNGLNLGVRGEGDFRTSVPERLPLNGAGLVNSLTAGLPSADGSLQLHGALASGSTSLLRFNAHAALADGAFRGDLEGTTLGNFGHLHLGATGRIGAGGDISLDTAQLRASLNLPGLSVVANATGTSDTRGGLDVTANAGLRLFGLQSIRANATGNVSSSGASLAGKFSGPGPLYTSYIFGDFALSTRGGNAASASVLGLTYTPGLSISAPGNPPNLPGSPKTPWTPSGVTLGATYLRYSQGNLNYISGGLMPDLSSQVFSNLRFGVSAQFAF
jgi:RHS repeat-associated protein